MSETVWVALITATAAILGAAVPQIFQTLNRKFEIQKWKAEFYMHGRIDAITSLHVAAYDLHETLSSLNIELATPGPIEQIAFHQLSKTGQEKYDAFHKALLFSTAYLEEDKVNDALDTDHTAAAKLIVLAFRILAEAPTTIDAEDVTLQPTDAQRAQWNSAYHAFTRASNILQARLGEELNPADLRAFHKHKQRK